MILHLSTARTLFPCPRATWGCYSESPSRTCHPERRLCEVRDRPSYSRHHFRERTTPQVGDPSLRKACVQDDSGRERDRILDLPTARNLFGSRRARLGAVIQSS